MSSYLIIKPGDEYVIYQTAPDRKRIYPEATYKSLSEVLALFLLGEFDIDGAQIKLGQGVATPEEADAFDAIISLFRNLRTEAAKLKTENVRLFDLEETVRTFPQDMPVGDLVRLLAESNVLKK